MRIARFVVDDDPMFGVVDGSAGNEEVAVIQGDPFYSGVQLTGARHALEDVRLHGGWLQAAGSPGRGSVFRMTLPRTAGRPVADTPLEAPR